MGPVGCLWVLIAPRIGLPFRLVLRPSLADDSFPTLRIRRLSDHRLGHERKQFRFSHCPSRRRAARHLHRTLPAGPPSHVLRRRSHAALHASGARLLVGAPRFPPCHPFDRPPPPQRRKNALPRPPRLFRLLPPHALPPPPPPLVTSLGWAPPPVISEQVDFFFPLRSCEAVGLRREKSLFLFRRSSRRPAAPFPSPAPSSPPPWTGFSSTPMSSSPVSAFGRSSPAADASRGEVERWL